MENEWPPKVQWRVNGANVFLWESEVGEWRQVTTIAQSPDDDSMWLYKNLLDAFDEPSAYEWQEGERRYRIERWSDEALEVARRNRGLSSNMRSG